MYADLVLTNGEIISMDAQKRTYQAIALKHGRIIALGTSSEMKGLMGSQTEWIDLKGRTVIPGIIDGHQHMLQFGSYLADINCDKDSLADLVEAIRERAARLRPTEWIVGWGFNEAKFKEKRLPTAEDFAGIPNPIYLSRYCLHAVVVNQTVLEQAGITDSTPDPFGGEIVRDDQGKVTGVLRENAMDLVKTVMPEYTVEAMKERIQLADRHYVSEGITAIHEAGMGFFTNSIEEFRAFQELTLEQAIHVRVYGMILDSFFPQAQAMRLMTGFGGDRFKIGPVKIFSDGTLNGRTAAVSQEYLDPPGTRGMMLLPPEELERKVLEAHKSGFQVSIHAIGDRAIDHVITAYEKALQQYPRKDHRHRIEHSAVTTPSLLARMKKLGLIPVPQPGIINLAGDVYRRVLKPEVLEGFYPLKTYLEMGIPVVGSSDCPVVPSSPFFGMYMAMSRHTASGSTLIPNQRVTLYEALQMYTMNAAYASFSEKEQGSLENGKWGDLVALPAGFMNFSAEEVRDTKVELTIVGGKVVYENNRNSLPV